ncbi:RagB/SusD family nutrient uptake outer membrane protein [Reichenbachiella carrageenanivorans]|uniref:RagB/SusD family nutrient uptake outer membrane protein n=1 Tax=Reichenbachiella carrageenanivorans TaxID=2979869 RepID=A0ABY6CUV7_9BACT|nr:RagB/SusD family nutrient uptake outer membrane protein [Reichenbachiella carrageenanivorans]UXX77699.1 RagB/SusD family nutrient uptake outer membrane protein [Reichenbachiella carrageenanivorans]
MKYLKYSLMISLFASLFLACSEDVLIENPPHIIAAENLYVDLDGFENGLNGLYAQFRRERGGEEYGGANDLLIDPAVSGVDNCYGNNNNGWNTVGNDFTRNVADENHNRNFYEWIYQTINSANTIIDRAENPEIEWSEEEKNGVLAEARFFRAWAYRHATYMWGDVPMNLSETKGSNIITDWVRSPIADVRAQMEEDWLFAEEHMRAPSNDGKVSKYVASHYLAELYLAMGENEKARDKALEVMAGPYSLITSRYGITANEPGTPFTDMFIHGNSNPSEGNTEALWVMQHEPDVNGGGDNLMRRWHRNQSHSVRVDGTSGAILITAENGGRGLGRIGPTRYALELYGSTDDRGGKFAWRSYEILNNPDIIPVGTNPETGLAWALGDTTYHDWQGQDEKTDNPYWPSTRKWDYAYELDLAGSRSYNDQIYLRLAETKLILAEAQFLTGDAPGAAVTINELRNRANATPIGAGDVSLDFILDERSRELYSEEHRRYTLVRMGKWMDRTIQYNLVGGPTITEKDKLFPIPQAVIDANLTLPMSQNPGYTTE